MCNILSKLPSPAVAGVVKEKTVRASIAEIKNCVSDGADMIDLHMSCLENTDIDTLRSIISASPLPVLALNYNINYDFTPSGFTEDERIELFLKAVDAGAAGVDIQGYTFHAPSKYGFCGEDKFSFTKGNPKEIVTDDAIINKQCEFIETVHGKGAEVLLSCHPGIFMTSDQVVELALFMEKRNPDIIKIVTIAENDDQLAESFKTMLNLRKHVKTTVSYHAGGKGGTLSRIINPLLGSHIAFCVDRFTESSNFDQLDLKASRSVIDCVKKMM